MTEPNADLRETADDGPAAGAPQPEETGNLANWQLGEFRILRRLGRGGMADVYLADQTSLHRHVALKVLRTESLTDEVHLERFRREAEAAGGLSHPNIVQVFTIGEADGVHYIAQEYVQGLNLREFLQKKGPPDVGVALHILKQVALALQVAGEAGIVHRDIKPENILVTRKGTVKVADFGLAQLSLGGGGGEALNLTQAGMTMGTPLYMSPEQVSGKKLDARSDIYSFGVTCYHILAARPPFEGETAMAVAVQHLNSEPAPLRKHRSDLPDALCHIVHKMMAKEPQQRYPDAKSVLADLRRVEKSIRDNPQAAAADVTIADFDPVLDTQRLASVSASHQLLQWAGRHPLVAFFGSCLVVAAFSAALVLAIQPPDPRDATPRTLPAKATVQEQYEIAQRLIDDEDAWLAVVDHQRPDPQILQPAREQLALLYLRELRFSEAQEIFDDFATMDDETIRDKGLAGMAISASLKQNYQMSRRLIETKELLRPDRINPDSDLGKLLLEANDANLRALKEDSATAGP
ncbi:MAG: serine/threonine protein kinase [Planctomycetaceae bacterium]|nr:serine/threonine protein kinase [Planctomycetaceae bacterium]MBT6484814.1 serine/threonine protein kinase [Planctomycetaceae bacterium]MBT6497638.1 serine/threonine protein kinase [Planctomycetaceae bacterium]